MPIAANPDGVLDIENATLRSREIATLSNFVAGNDEIRSSGAPVLEVYGDPANVGGLLPTLELVSNTESVTGTSFTRFTSNAGVFTLQSGTGGDADSKGDIAFSSVGGDTEHMRIQGSTGNVGIGTVSPGKKLEIADGYQSLGGYIDTYNILGINGGMVLGVRQGGGAYVDGMRISGAGWVGIGTGNPLARLQVGDGLTPAVNTRDADGSISVFGTGRKKVDPGKPGIYHRESVGLGLSSDYHMSFEVNGSTSPLEAMRILNNGNVGIGIDNNLNAPLTIFKSGGAADQAGGGITLARSIPAGFRGASIWSEYTSGLNKDVLAFGVSSSSDPYGGTPQMVVTSDGLVGIGTANPLYALDFGSAVIKSIRGKELRIYGQDSVHGPNMMMTFLGTATLSNHFGGLTNNSRHLGWSSWAWSQLYVTNLYRTNEYGYSDDRLKTNETIITNAMDTLLKLKPEIYDKHLFEYDFLSDEEYANVQSNNLTWSSHSNTFVDVSEFVEFDVTNIDESQRMHHVTKSWIKRTLGDVTHREAGFTVQDMWYEAPELRHIISLSQGARPGDVKPDGAQNIEEDSNTYTNTEWGYFENSISYTNLHAYTIKAMQELHTELQDTKAQLASVLARLDALESA
jgi:hypothetical protein